MAASVFESDYSHMDWGWENREGVVTLPTPTPTDLNSVCWVGYNIIM
jgi:hypothetical protein